MRLITVIVIIPPEMARSVPPEAPTPLFGHWQFCALFLRKVSLPVALTLDPGGTHYWSPCLPHPWHPSPKTAHRQCCIPPPTKSPLPQEECPQIPQLSLATHLLLAFFKGDVQNRSQAFHMDQEAHRIAGPSLCVQDSGPLSLQSGVTCILPVATSHCGPLRAQVCFLWTCSAVSNEQRARSL